MTRLGHLAVTAVRHLGISTVRGQFMKTNGTIVSASADIGKTQIEVTIDASEGTIHELPAENR